MGSVTWSVKYATAIYTQIHLIQLQLTEKVPSCDVESGCICSCVEL